MVLAVGDRVNGIPMAKLIFQHATQRGAQRDGINWQKTADVMTEVAHEIFGGVWQSGFGKYGYNCSNASEAIKKNTRNLLHTWIHRTQIWEARQRHQLLLLKTAKHHALRIVFLK